MQWTAPCAAALRHAGPSALTAGLPHVGASPLPCSPLPRPPSPSCVQQPCPAVVERRLVRRVAHLSVLQVQPRLHTVPGVPHRLHPLWPWLQEIGASPGPLHCIALHLFELRVRKNKRNTWQAVAARRRRHCTAGSASGKRLSSAPRSLVCTQAQPLSLGCPSCRLPARFLPPQSAPAAARTAPSAWPARPAMWSLVLAACLQTAPARCPPPRNAPAAAPTGRSAWPAEPAIRPWAPAAQRCVGRAPPRRLDAQRFDRHACCLRLPPGLRRLWPAD